MTGLKVFCKGVVGGLPWEVSGVGGPLGAWFAVLAPLQLPFGFLCDGELVPMTSVLFPPPHPPASLPRLGSGAGLACGSPGCSLF